jgi:hypothetical protein
MKHILALALPLVALISNVSAQNFGLAETFGNGGAATFVPGQEENTQCAHHFLPDGRMLGIRSA